MSQYTPSTTINNNNNNNKLFKVPSMAEDVQ
jgi:hypothetical protein